MQIQLNGKAHDVATDTTVCTLIADLGLSPDGVAVAINAAVIPRSTHPQTRLQPGDRVEIIQAVGGG